MRNILRHAFFAFLAAVLVITLPASAKDIEKIRILAPITGGLEGGSFSKLINDVGKVMEKETGLKFEYKEVVYRMGDPEGELVYEAFRNGEAELTFMTSSEYIEKKDKWEDVFRPGFTIIFNGSKHQNECMYVREGEGIEKLEDLRGKVWGASRIYPTRLLLLENGIDEPLSEFFGKMLFIEDAPVSNSVDALQSGKIDCFVANKNHLVIGGGGAMPAAKDEQKSKVKYETVACTPGEMHWIFLFHKDVPEEIRNKITATLVTANQNDAFNQFKFIFYAIKGGFAPIEKGDLDRTKEIVKLKTTKGWNEERDEHLKRRPEKE